jgi:hypothetical protein
MPTATGLLAFSAAQWILLLGFMIPVAILWGYAIASLFRRPDLTIGPRLAWLAGILLFPILGSAVYFMLRPAPTEQNRRAQALHKKR